MKDNRLSKFVLLGHTFGASKKQRVLEWEGEESLRN